MGKKSAVATAVEKYLKEQNAFFYRNEDKNSVCFSVRFPETTLFAHIVVWEGNISFGIFIPFNYEDITGELEALITQKNKGCLFGKYTYDEETYETEFAVRIVNRGEISTFEIDVYLDYVFRQYQHDYDDFLQVMGYKDPEDYWEEDDFAPEEEACGYLEIPFGDVFDPCDIYSYILKAEYEEGVQDLIHQAEDMEYSPTATNKDVTAIKSKIAFLIRFGKVLSSELKAPFDLDVARLLEDGTEEGDAFSLVNKALLEISLRRFDKATEWLLKLDTREKWTDIQETWEVILWDMLECSEGALIAWMADMTYGRAGDEAMVEAAERDYEEYVNSDAFRRLRGRLYAIAVREAK